MDPGGVGVTGWGAPRPAPSGEYPLDLADPKLHAEYDLTDTFRRWRDESPVFWHEAGDRPAFWVLTRYADVAAVYRDAERFTSERGNVLDTLLAGGDPAAGRMAAVTDGRRHKELRAVMMRGFTKATLAAVADNVRRATTQLVAAAVAAGTADFATDVAAKIPLAAICDLLDVPAADRGELLRMTSTALAAADGAPVEADAWGARSDILLYFTELAAKRRDRPADDLLSILVGSRIDGEPLSHQEIIYNCYSLIMGGDETTRYSMVGAVRALAEHPDQWHAYTTGAVDTDSAVEEILRWTTPTLHAGRTATEDVLLGGQFIEAGDLVTIWNGSANADERQFDEPGTLRLDRTPNRHLTFAYGPHFCIGAPLARIELQVALKVLFERLPKLALAAEPKYRDSYHFHGLEKLDVQF